MIERLYISKEVARIFRNKRKEMGISQTDFAERIGSSRSYISRIELGDIMVRPWVVKQIVMGLNIPLESLGLEKSVTEDMLTLVGSSSAFDDPDGDNLRKLWPELNKDWRRVILDIITLAVAESPFELMRSALLETSCDHGTPEKRRRAAKEFLLLNYAIRKLENPQNDEEIMSDELKEIEEGLFDEKEKTNDK